MRKVLFVCVENSFRSQMAEAYFNKFAPENWMAISAGIKPADKVHPKAIQLMREEGIDISHKKPQLLTRELQEKAELAIIVCSGTECPLVYVKHVRKWNLPDPTKMSIDEARKVRDIIKKKVLELIEELASKYS